eukprot:GHVQ01042452.1.p1 GENE.GHVQ01042452.1~~GHVQ01042452.1.p1  ORF type:complete len:449 (+),score=59.05 GHVQ01042452.1:582-1928(+)
MISHTSSPHTRSSLSSDTKCNTLPDTRSNIASCHDTVNPLPPPPLPPCLSVLSSSFRDHAPCHIATQSSHAYPQVDHHMSSWDTSHSVSTSQTDSPLHYSSIRTTPSSTCNLLSPLCTKLNSPCSDQSPCLDKTPCLDLSPFLVQPPCLAYVANNKLQHRPCSAGDSDMGASDRAKGSSVVLRCCDKDCPHDGSLSSYNPYLHSAVLLSPIPSPPHLRDARTLSPPTTRVLPIVSHAAPTSLSSEVSSQGYHQSVSGSHSNDSHSGFDGSDFSHGNHRDTASNSQRSAYVLTPAFFALASPRQRRGDAPTSSMSSLYRSTPPSNRSSASSLVRLSPTTRSSHKGSIVASSTAHSPFAASERLAPAQEMTAREEGDGRVEDAETDRRSGLEPEGLEGTSGRSGHEGTPRIKSKPAHFNELRSRILYLERENIWLATQRHDLDMRVRLSV